MNKMTVGLRLDRETQDRLKKLAQVRDRSPHYLMTQAVETYLDREEAIEAENELMQSRWEVFALTGETLSQAEIETWARQLAKTGNTS